MEHGWPWYIAAGFVLDLLIGDPEWMYHPVRFAGAVVKFFEKPLMKIADRPKTEKRSGLKTEEQGGPKRSGIYGILAGALLVLSTLSVCFGSMFILLCLADHIGKAAGFVFRAWICGRLFAARSLRDASMKVFHRLEEGDLNGARQALSMIVGRETESLDEQGVTRAAVETVAENASDAVIAPMFYMFLGGPLAAWLYKCINTLDSMVGYKNDKYLFFGRAAARLDDIANFIPARICALLMAASAPLAGLDARKAFKIWKRDAKKSSSPNAGHPEAAMAGALHVRLGGDAVYFGKLHEKAFLGDDDRAAESMDIRRADDLMYISSAASMLLMMAPAVIAWLIKAG